METIAITFCIFIIGVCIGIMFSREVTDRRQVKKALATEAGDHKVEFINGQEYYILTSKHFHRIKRQRLV